MRRGSPRTSHDAHMSQQQERGIIIMKTHTSDDGPGMDADVAAAASARQNSDIIDSPQKKGHGGGAGGYARWIGLVRNIRNFGGIRFLVLMILCLQNSMFTILRRYSLGVLKEDYSKVREGRKWGAVKNDTCSGSFIWDRLASEVRLTYMCLLPVRHCFFSQSHIVMFTYSKFLSTNVSS